MKTTTVRDVELLSVGMKWQSANGELTFTFQHLADAAAAAEDPHIQPPRLKVGHSDSRFNDLENDHDPFALIGDGEPAIGSVRNIRLANEGSMLVGDYVDVPIWLAEALPTAFPSRSIEGAWSMKEGPAGEAMGSWDIETPGGKRYSFVLTACALLGVVGPAISNIDDLRNWLVEGKGLVVAGAPPVEGAVPADASTVGDMLVPEMSADVEQVVDKFCHDFASSPDEEGYWWWPISLETDAGTLYCDDEEGGIMAVPYTTDEDTNVSFGEPYRVIKRYEAAPEPAEMAAVLCHGNPAVVFRSVKETPLAARHAAKKPAKGRGSKASATVSAMDPLELSAAARKRLAVSLSLADEATDEEITEALEAEETTETEETPAEETPVAESPAPAASAEDTTVKVDKAVWDRNQAEIARLSKVADKIEADEQAAVLDAAILSGKIMESSRKSWGVKLAANREATEAEIESLAEGLVPTSQVGHSQQVVEAGGAVGGMTPAEATAQLFPNLVNEKGEL